jgi:hypothetical protein
MREGGRLYFFGGLARTYTDLDEIKRVNFTSNTCSGPGADIAHMRAGSSGVTWGFVQTEGSAGPTAIYCRGENSASASDWLVIDSDC